MSFLLKLCGEFRLESKRGSLIEIKSVKAQALLCFLTINNTAPQSRQRICHLLWPDSELADARNSLRQVLSNLRKSLVTGRALVTTRDLVGLDMTMWDVDVARCLKTSPIDDFECIKAVTKLCERDLLENHPTVTSTFDDWLQIENSRYREHLSRLRMRLLREYEKQADWYGANSVGSKLLMDDPYNEKCYRILIRMLIDNGENTKAITLYTKLTELLNEEFATAPEIATQDVVKPILGKDIIASTPHTNKVIRTASDNLIEAANVLAEKNAHLSASKAFKQAAYLYSSAGEKFDRDAIAAYLNSAHEHYVQADFEAAAKSAQSALEIANKGDDVELVTRCLLAIANSEFAIGNLYKACTLAKRAIINCKHSQDRDNLIRSNLVMANARFLRGDYELALDVLSENIRLLELNPKFQADSFDVGHPRIISLNLYAWCCSETGKFKRGINALNQATVLAKNLNDAYSMLSCRVCLGVLYLHQLEHQKSLASLTKTLAQLETVGFEDLKPTVQISMALCNVAVGDLRSAGELINGNLNIPEHPILHAALGLIHTSLGDIETAQKHIAQGYKIAERIDAQGDLGWCWLSRAVCSFTQGDQKNGALAIENARAIALQKKMIPLLANISVLES